MVPLWRDENGGMTGKDTANRFVEQSTPVDFRADPYRIAVFSVLKGKNGCCEHIGKEVPKSSAYLIL